MSKYGNLHTKNENSEKHRTIQKHKIKPETQGNEHGIHR